MELGVKFISRFLGSQIFLQEEALGTVFLGALLSTIGSSNKREERERLYQVI